MELLNDVVHAIRAEPLRAYMGTWAIRTLADWKAMFPRMKRRPPCNTAGCVAAWIVLLRDGKLPKHSPFVLSTIPQRAEAILGVHDVFHLFAGRVLDDKRNELTYGTRQYVDAVVDRIRRFQGRHEEVLRKPFATK